MQTKSLQIMHRRFGEKEEGRREQEMIKSDQQKYRSQSCHRQRPNCGTACIAVCVSALLW